MENPIRMDDLGVPIFLETPKYRYTPEDLHGTWEYTPGREN